MKPGKVRPIALCVIRKEDRIFVTEALDPSKGQIFYRPLGGTIEFGERGAETVVREIEEEIGATVTDVRYLGTLENIFVYNATPGHEIVLMYEGRFADPAFERRERAESIEPNDDAINRGIWKPLSMFREGRAPLYPDGLLELLDRA